MPAAAERPDRYQQDRERYRQERYQDDRYYDDRYNEDRDRKQSRRTPATERTAAEAPAPVPLQPDGPLTMLVSLSKQRMYVYDSKGLFTQTRVSSGQKGFDTPVGIYSILEKKEDHASNIYESAPMPHMQRLTQTGIALHGGVVPGYAASHGCVRLPFEFAKKFFDLTDVNQRVVIAPDAQAPVEIDHALLFASLPRGVVASVSSELTDKSDNSGLQRIAATTDIAPRTLLSVADERMQERNRLVDAAAAAREAGFKAEDELPVATKAADDAKKAMRRAQGLADAAKRNAVKAARAKANAEGKLASLSKRLAGDTSKMKADKLEALRKDETEAKERIPVLAAAADQAAAEADRTRAEAEALQAAYKNADAARVKVKAAIKTAAADEKKAEKATEAFDRQERNRELPVSVLISSKTSMIKVRQGWENIYEGPVTIENPEQPLGTFLLSATGWRDSSQTSIKWTVAAVSEHPLSDQAEAMPEEEDEGVKRKSKKAEAFAPPPQTDRTTAAAALDRIKIPQEAVDRISEVIKPGSSFIISDYDVAKSEMRYLGTDFIVQMPEVVAKISRPKPKRDEYYDEDYGWSFFGPPPSQKRRSRPYGGKFFF